VSPAENEAIIGADLPEGWTVVPATTLAELIRGVSYKKGEALTSPHTGHVALIRANNIDGQLVFDDLQYVPEARVSDEQMLRVGDIVIAMSSGSKKVVGKTAQLRNAWCGAFGAFCGVLRPNLHTDSKFLGWFLQTSEYRNAISEGAAGTNINNLSRGHFDDIHVPYPPLAEQKRIVEAIERLTARVDAARERLAKVPAILKRFRQAVLAAACSGDLTTDWRHANPAIRPSSESLAKFDSQASQHRQGSKARKGGNELDLEAMPELPETWVYRRADSVVADGTVITYGIVLPGPEIPNGVPYVRQQDIQDGRLLVDELRRTTPEIAAKHDRSALLSGDVLLCIIRHLRVAVVPPGIDGANLTQGTVRMRPSPVMTGPFLAKYLAGPHAQAWMKQRHFGMSMPRINVEHARAIPVAVPPPSEQCEIVRRLGAMMKLADAIGQRVALASARSGKVTQAILAKAFRGELVPTEAELARIEGREYEPADELLARIRSANHPAPSKRGCANGRLKRRPKR